MRELRTAAKNLIRDRASTVAGVLSLTLAVASTVVVYVVLSAFLAAATPGPHADLAHVRGGTTSAPGVLSMHSVEVELWEERLGAIDASAVYASTQWLLSRGSTHIPLRGATVSERFFDVLGVRPQKGRLPRPSDASGRGGEVAISFRLWRSQFGGAEDVVGEAVRLNMSGEFNIVGVMPAGFRFPNESDVWWASGAERGFTGIPLVRLAQGVEPGLVGPALTALEANGEPQHFVVRRLSDEALAGIPGGLLLFVATSMVLLLFASADIARLGVARVLMNRRHIALRFALGSSRAAIVRAIILESALVACSASVLGLLLVKALILRVEYSELPYLNLSGGTLEQTMFVAIVSIVIIGITMALPAIVAMRTKPGSLVGANRIAGGSRAGNLLLAVEALSTTALVCTAFALVGGLYASEGSSSMGFEANNLLVARYRLPFAPELVPAEQLPRWSTEHRRIAQAVALAPWSDAGGVAITDVPSRSRTRVNVKHGAYSDDPEDPGQSTLLHVVTPGYVEALGLRILSGRLFGWSDLADGTTRSRPSAVVNRTLSRALFFDENAVGRTLIADFDGIEREIIGVVPDVRSEGPRAAISPELYVMHDTAPGFGGAVLVRTTGDHNIPLYLGSVLERTVAGVGVVSVQTMANVVDEGLSDLRLAALAGSFMAIIALVLTLVGIVGHAGHYLARRKTEMAVRAALGARRMDLLLQVIKDVSPLLLAGALLGILVSVVAVESLGASFVGGVAVPSWVAILAFAGMCLASGAALSVGLVFRFSFGDPLDDLRE